MPTFVFGQTDVDRAAVDNDAQVEVCGSDDELFSVLAKFRHTLLNIPLPPPAAVDYDQALKDAQRETIEVRVSPLPCRLARGAGGVDFCQCFSLCVECESVVPRVTF